ncbi:hypothetical protein NDU88_001265 [Pleurodeles waltl]|uniref:Uncharacterized protein n=1 Tax=Pleurodeles waltl TaxID=8319 RepID=A0AAV7U5V4_PLEWA|nr:hypothetical protein NDU88_001265 [Pleurodeles waltl]
MERILQEITVVGRRLEDMGTKILDLAAESRSIHNDIASFQERVTNIDHRLSLVEDKLNSSPNSDHELQYLRDKITDLEDLGHRDNVRFFGILEWAEGILAYEEVKRMQFILEEQVDENPEEEEVNLEKEEEGVAIDPELQLHEEHAYRKGAPCQSKE